MQSKTKEEKEIGKVGRPEIFVDWDNVDKLIMAQCTMNEIAGNVGMHPVNFGNKFKDKHGEDFTNYAVRMRSKGKCLLRAKQYHKAMEGNIQMLLRLGEIYLEQDRKNFETNEQIVATFTDFVDQLSSIQSDRKIADSNIKTEQSSD
jgi:hypothetical protein